MRASRQAHKEETKNSLIDDESEETVFQSPTHQDDGFEQARDQIKAKDEESKSQK